MPFAIEVRYRFRTNQPTRTCYQNFHNAKACCYCKRNQQGRMRTYLSLGKNSPEGRKKSFHDPL